MGVLITFENVGKIYHTGDVVYEALHDVNLTIDEGEMVVILGPSGAGKSTLLNMLGGLDAATSGKITFGDKEITALNDVELGNFRSKDVGIIFQFYNLIPTLNAYENVALMSELGIEIMDPKEAQLASLSSELSVASAEYESAVAEGNAEAVRDARQRVSGIENQIKTNRTALISLDTRSMTLEEYNVYLEVLRHLDLIDRFWNQNIEQQNIAKQAIVPDSQLAQYADSLELAKIQESKANRDLDIANNGLSVSYEGTIIEKMVDPGAIVEAGAPLFIIQPATGYKAKVMVSRFDIGKVAVGQEAEINIGGTTYEGVVDSISPVAENDSSNKPKVKVFVKLKDASAKPTIGLEADVKIYMEEMQNVVTVNDKALNTDDTGNYVYVLESGKIARRDVTVGSKGGGRTEIIDGLSENEQVIISPVSEEDIGSRRFVD